MTDKTTFNRIYEKVKLIPYGKVATYGYIAAMAGNPRWARVVGYALHVNPDPKHIPCHRVVNRLEKFHQLLRLVVRIGSVHCYKPRESFLMKMEELI